MFFLLWQRAEIGLASSENTRICETSSIFGILFTLTLSKGNRLEANQPLTKPSNRIGGGTACSSFRNKNGSLGKGWSLSKSLGLINWRSRGGRSQRKFASFDVIQFFSYSPLSPLEIQIEETFYNLARNGKTT